MIKMDSIYAVSDFSRKPAAHIKRLRETGRPEILTVNGKAELVIQDARAYEEMVELLTSFQLIELAAKSHDDGKAFDAKVAFAKLRERLA